MATPLNQAAAEPIAIVGSACRFPGDATSPAKLWQLLKEPRDVLSEIPESRFNTKTFYHPDGSHHGTTNVRHSYLLSDDHRLFDAQFFGTKPIEANSIDPQQRLLLETVYEGLECAGIPMEKLQGSNTGVYVGLMTNDYADMLGRDVQNFPTYFASGTARSILSNRISYFFDWHGPSMTIDTACSSSLVALHQAVQSLRNGESNVAIAAGTNLLLGPEQYIAESKLKMLSPTGRSRMWDKDADGYARGDGIAVVVLKPLSRALADGDHIECIVRETGINQDGRTKGITMPNPVAQASLIHETYARAGLDLSRESDRPQYFEAHGTGTPAGDPVEAQAISTAFFGPQPNYYRTSDKDSPLYVGSIKTVIGHTEGTAGLAAVLKASLALQHATVPPNLLLNELNPTVRPFYKDLRILQKDQKWPDTTAGGPRRASVNSFGFGGANAHAILESFDNQRATADDAKPANSGILPFNFSANSETSLVAILEAYAAHLRANSDIDLRDLSWTLNARRSTLPFRISVSGSDAVDLATKLEKAAQSTSEILPSSKTRSVKKPKLLGIFTGQGAQWARMGANIVSSSQMASDCISELDLALQTLPEQDRPCWTLRDEIAKDLRSSRIGEALFSQTLCTAVQVMLVQLLWAAGVEFTAVVGHSSGEIAAAYAAGYISASDAIRIAYYRGWSLRHTGDEQGSTGAMMAVGTSLEDAQELCGMPSLEGRVCVAAANSPASVTISGDFDAVLEAKEIFEDEKKFARLLKVDKAYHSHHMLPCAAPYIAAMRRCGIDVECPRSDRKSAWISSVYVRDINDVTDSLADTYWSNNMTNPVMFSQAISHAVAAHGPFDMGLEVGPHPALKGPALQTLQEVSGSSIPYSGVLSRGKCDRESFAAALGALWANLGEHVANFTAFDREVSGKGRPPKLLKELPSYAWDHDRVYWHESRISSSSRVSGGGFHLLLGTKCPDGTDKELRWRNYLNTKEIPWLVHHQVQGQIVFPAAGYISALTESLIQQYGIEAIHLIEIEDFIIGQALVLEENASTEVVFTLTIFDSSDKSFTASFKCYSAGTKGASTLLLHASAQVQVILGTSDASALPVNPSPLAAYLQVEQDRFYNFVSVLGFGYTGPFRALTDLTRKINESTGRILVSNSDGAGQPLLVHPATLDCAIQAIMLAYSFPGDGRLRSLYLPTKIDRLRINPVLCRDSAGPGSLIPFAASVAKSKFAELSGDVDIFSADGKNTLIQLEGLHTTPLTQLSQSTDVPMFTEMTWAPESPGCRANNDILLGLYEDRARAVDLERLAHYYLKSLANSVTESQRSQVKSPFVQLLSYADHSVALVKSGDHHLGQESWANGEDDIAREIIERLGSSPDSEILQAVGQNLPAIVRGDRNILDILLKDDMLGRFYETTLGIDSYLAELRRIAAVIGNKYPHINVLEIGAGAGEATAALLDGLGESFSSYTYTDFMQDWLDRAQTKFEVTQAKMVLRILDIEKDITEQGYTEKSYDLVVASLALYATSNTQQTLSNVRRLLKPGGYLLLLELTDPSLMRFTTILGCLPGWWLGHEDGRELSPCRSPAQWHDIMQKAGFSGIDCSKPHDTDRLVPFSVMLTQAVDSRISFLRDPFAGNHHKFRAESLTIIGGRTTTTARLIDQIGDLCRQSFKQIRCYSELAEVNADEISFMGTLLGLTELDEPAFLNLSSRALEGFQALFKQSKNVLWVVQGAQGDKPGCNLFRGIQRTLAMEMRHLRIQSLNFGSLAETDGQLIAKQVLCLAATDQWEADDQLNDILWYTEPELSYQQGEMLIPRIRLSSLRNNRYNSAKRLIVKEVDREVSTVAIKRAQGYEILPAELSRHPEFSDSIHIEVTHSLLRSIQIVDNDFLFLVAGKQCGTEKYIVALAQETHSRVVVPRQWILAHPESKSEAAQSLLRISVSLLVRAVLSDMVTGSSLVVLEPDFSVASVIIHQACRAGIQLVLLTSKDRNCCKPWVYVHPRVTQRDLLNKIPGSTFRVFNVGADWELARLVKEVLRLSRGVDNEGHFTRHESQLSSRLDLHFAALEALKVHLLFDLSNAPAYPRRIPSITLRDLMGTNLLSGQHLIDWDATRLPTQIRPATETVTFSSRKTYWLVGLTSGLGLSLCEWMAGQGARYIALSSRNPKIDSAWLQKMALRGCTVRIFANDITDRESVYDTHRHISESMPPIAGVAQGAMVLQDTMFLDLDLTRFNSVLSPKVQGSLLLDEIFSDDSLDFMIFFSSMAAVTGNPGQAAYNAANMFMASLAAQRQQRGLVAHAINIGAIVGNGYVTRELNMSQQNYLYKVGHTWMSEQDFREIFAEGILSCLQRDQAADICSGLRIDEDETKDWVTNPIFQHLVMKSNTLIEDGKKGTGSIMIKARLIEATSEGDAMEALQDAFSVKLQSALQLDPTKPILDMSPDELGVDSLNAVDFRSYFLKELSVDVPVLKIFNAGSIRDLLKFVFGCLPTSLVPNIKKSNEGPLNKEQAPEPSTPADRKSEEQSSVPVANKDSSDGAKSFHLSYLATAKQAGSISSVSAKADDSSSDQDGDSSSQTSLENDSNADESNVVERVAPMSFGQSRFWFLKSLVQDQTAFNVTPTFELCGEIDIKRFARAVESVCQQHEALRTFFFVGEDKKHMQGVLKRSPVRLEHRYIQSQADVELATNDLKNHVFDLAGGEVIRVQLLTLAPDHHWFLIGFHHINMDGVSFEILWSQVESAYENDLFKLESVQYPDFTIRQIKEYEEGVWSDDLEYWRCEFETIPEAIPLLPFSLRPARPTVSAYSTIRSQLRIGLDLSREIESCCRLFKVTPFHFHLAMWQILLQRHLNLEQICIGLTDSNRTDIDILQSVGMFLNLLPLSLSLTSSQSFGETLKAVKNVSQNALAHSKVPFDVILSELNVPRSASHSPLFQVLYNYRPRVEESRLFCGCQASGSLQTTGETSNDLQLDVVNLGDGDTMIHLLVQKNIYEPEHAQILLRSYEHLIRAFVQNPATKVSWPSLFPAEDIQQAIAAGKGSELPSKWPATVLHRIEEMAEAFPSHVALKEPRGIELTYAQMRDTAASIANELLVNGVQVQDRVGVLQSAGVRWICSALAIWQVGAIYIPLDKKAGIERLSVMVRESKPKLILMDTTTMKEFELLHCSAQAVNVSSAIASSTVYPSIAAEGAQTAVITFTSGSTGVPKGICLSHAAHVNQIEASTQACDIKPGQEIILQQSPYAWDMSIFQILLALCNGAKLVIAPLTARGDPVAITDIIAAENVTATLATPTEYHTWLRHGRHALEKSSLTLAVSGGEPITDHLLKEFKSICKPDLRLINVYGPAEVTIACSVQEVSYSDVESRSSEESVGLATLPNYSVYIADEQMQPMPIGIPGEVIVGGAGIAQRYLNLDATKDAFVQDQFASPYFVNQGWSRVHRTGDRGKITHDGRLVLLGRIKGDNQVKLGGIRINVEEIESCILRSSGGAVSQAIVSLRTGENQEARFLAAFLVFSDANNSEVSSRVLNELKANLPLPQYMRPAIFVPMASLPQNSSGKVDRLAMHNISIQDPTERVSSHGALTTIEQELSILWRESIACDNAGLHSIDSRSDFFHVGGSSLTLVDLQGLIKDRLGISVPLHELFAASTLRGMAERLENMAHSQEQAPIDWEREIADLLSDLSPAHETDTFDQPSGLGNVILTGSTGFIGKEILRQLVKDDQVVTVYCLAVRKPLAKLPALFAHPKIHVYHGDLGSPRLGLSDKDASSIFRAADIVIHNGADVSFMKTYQSLKLTNVYSTTELAKLSLPRRVPLHFISSASVTRFSGKTTFGECSVAAFPPPSIPNDGYATAKWVSEVYLEKANAAHRLPVWIHRPSSVMGSDVPELDLMSNVLQYCRSTKKLPASEAWSGVFDFIPVESAAAQIIRAVHRSADQAGAGTLRYLFESGEVQVGHEELQAKMEADSGHEFETVPLMDWVNAAEEAGMSRLLGMYLRQAASGQVLLPRLIKGAVSGDA
ncbi:Polyketide synthase-nonribosomal peptide synthetase [Penicillium diatomitis]|uniref:Polyketide synthase-nonribosomal peptide synthetase n=1 Tax=Penicillium diatomitis TaxID=2819901 RepID=A0A9W9X726_9EURO|nr:Polyketide synthase-nonribosomal peptide synthetase [Penicillium diatomitis]KAJ5485543.1 Polyketide synthase-nonribosomal peptide synthetase [Penicillium diatomitis]